VPEPERVLRPQRPREPATRPRTPSSPVATPASTVGNAHFARLVAPGCGLLPGGGVHPRVEGLIRERSGRGSRVDSGMASWASERLDPAVGRATIHTDATADALARSVAAKAFTVRNDVFFAAGAYQPHTEPGRSLIAHELTHVAQQRGAAATGPLTVSEPGDALERDAERVADGLDQDG
jgi:Domain of unknown function (DUF4157)